MVIDIYSGVLQYFQKLSTICEFIFYFLWLLKSKFDINFHIQKSKYYSDWLIQEIIFLVVFNKNY